MLRACLLAASPAVVLSIQAHSGLSCRKTHIIHIGKTGGSSVNRFLWAVRPEERTRLQFENHHFVLGAGEPEDCYAFFVRDPVERWVSGFLEDLKMLWKGNCNEENKWAYKLFKTPTELAEALESSDETRRANALKANEIHFHTRNNFAHYLPNLTGHLHRIVFVGETRNLRHDFEALCQKTGIMAPNLSSVASDNVCPDALEWMKAISPTARGNLGRLLKEDYKIMETLRAAGLIASTSLHRQGCVAPQERCVVIGADGQFRMIGSTQNPGPVDDIYRLLNATRAEELPSDT